MDAGCDPALAPLELQSCSQPSDCGCPMLCAPDPQLGRVCEYPCVQLNDCPDLFTTCNGTTCGLNYCGGNTGNGGYDSFCDVVGTNDGTCIPDNLDGGLVGLCMQGGFATGACSTSASRSQLPEDCTSGNVCTGGAIGSGGICGVACNPDDGSNCPPDTVCSGAVGDPFFGICVSFTGG